MDLLLHHIGMLVRDIPKAADFYARMGYEVKSAVINDPVQTANVQFFRLPGDAAYLELVSPDGPGGKLNNALEQGGGLNHVCYSTGDIETACEALRDAGFLLISAPTAAVAFDGRRVAWFRGRDRLQMELVERGGEGEL